MLNTTAYPRIGDQVKPICSQCQKKNRPCIREDPSKSIRIKPYQPRKARGDPKDALSHDSDEIYHPAEHRTADTVIANPTSPEHIPNSSYAAFGTNGSVTSPYNPQGSTNLPKLTNDSVPAPLMASPVNNTTNSPYFSVVGLPISHLLRPDSLSPWSAASPAGAIHAGSPLTYREAHLVHHFATHLGYWLDCTDASRQFTRKIPILVKQSPILLHAVLSYAARHVGDAEMAEQAHERCVELLIPSLSSETVTDDDILLCAIVILRVFEQLNVMVTGSDQERHLAGCSALLRASQGREVDPSTPGLRQAAFWVYMRQCLYNACVHQQAPNVDLNLVLIPPPAGSDPLSDLRSETAWANTMTWICATVVHFCFGSSYPEPSSRIRRWQELSEAVENWLITRPDTFDPIWYSEAVKESGNPFPEIWFTADWHIMAFGFYHLACMLLAIYKPSPKFAVRGLHSPARESDVRVMMHARAICGACNSSPSTVPSLITLCHSTFIWGPLMTDSAERAGVIRLLRDMEATHAWPTTWIINSLKEEWTMT
ncbi:C6 transcription factor [Penicillium brasilianum]|uniref:C6 transcription factor n=1 Tax=Penicillium brasilianum TaxID=104259 RepID=A0A1S9RA71_PENBI|nr:C6 transcription factor [Penicillium brasilianum]